MKGRIAEAGLQRQGRGQHVSYWHIAAVAISLRSSPLLRVNVPRWRHGLMVSE
jgi:hypothetical protein